jgi:hypothetical protein
MSGPGTKFFYSYVEGESCLSLLNIGIEERMVVDCWKLFCPSVEGGILLSINIGIEEFPAVLKEKTGVGLRQAVYLNGDINTNIHQHRVTALHARVWRVLDVSPLLEVFVFMEAPSPCAHFIPSLVCDHHTLLSLVSNL